MKAVAYIRVSSTSQVDGYSLSAQERLFHEYCKGRGWEPVGTYREEGRSAHHESVAKRPVLKVLLEDAAEGGFDAVVVHTLDRWSRNLKTTLESLSVLGKHDVALVSITENIDYSTPQGKLFTQLLGSFAQYYSDALATHVSKGLDQRAREGLDTGGIPFGYGSCWAGQKGQRQQQCDPEHLGAVHIHPEEGPAVAKLFKRYATGMTTLAELAGWLNAQSFRTRNTHKAVDAKGDLVAGPRLFTTASVRVILHNAFYAGMVKYRDERLPGIHQPLVSQEVYDLVQATMRKNSGRSETLNTRPERQYLLKGIIRCAYCGMPMWAQTYQNGNRYYREHRATRGLVECPAHGGSIRCEAADEQVGRLVEAVVLERDWLDRALAQIEVKDEVDRIRERRLQLEERRKRLGRAYVDGHYSDEEYRRQMKAIGQELDTLVVPEATAAEEAGQLVEQLPALWREAGMDERRRLLLTMLEAVYVDAKEEKQVVAIRPKAPFRPVFQVASTREASGVVLIQEPPDNCQEAHSALCSWWRRGGVEPPVQKTPR